MYMYTQMILQKIAYWVLGSTYVFYILEIYIHIHVPAQCTQNPTQDIVYWVQHASYPI